MQICLFVSSPEKGGTPTQSPKISTVRLCVCVESLTPHPPPPPPPHPPPFKQRGEYVCNVCIFSVLWGKKKKLKEN